VELLIEILELGPHKIYRQQYSDTGIYLAKKLEVEGSGTAVIQTYLKDKDNPTRRFYVIKDLLLRHQYFRKRNVRSP